MAHLSLIALSVLLGAAGNAPIVPATDQPAWYRPNATPERIHHDTEQCEKEARLQAPSFGTTMRGAERMLDLQERCMKSRGYYRVRKDGTRLD